MFHGCGSICDVLVLAGILSQDRVADILSNSAAHGMTAGQVLVKDGTISPTLARAAVVSMFLAHDRLLPSRTAIGALRLMHEEKLQFEDALLKLGFNRHFFEHLKLATGLLERSDLLTAAEKDSI